MADYHRTCALQMCGPDCEKACAAKAASADISLEADMRTTSCSANCMPTIQMPVASSLGSAVEKVANTKNFRNETWLQEAHAHL